MFQTISMSWRAAWNTLTTFSSAISAKNGARSMPVGQRVDHDGLVGARHLRDAEQRVIGGLAQEFGVDGDEGVLRHMRAGLGEFRGGGDQRPLSAGSLTRSGSCHGKRFCWPRTRGMWMNSQGRGQRPDRHLDQRRLAARERFARAPRAIRAGLRARAAGGAEAFRVFDEIGIGEIARRSAGCRSAPPGCGAHCRRRRRRTRRRPAECGGAWRWRARCRCRGSRRRR